MVDLLKEFQSKSIPQACDYLSDYCEVYINTSGMSMNHARSLHSAIPGILTIVFGAPTSRGWIHIEILPEHNASIRRTFRSDGPFLKALIQLAKYPEYSYDMVPEAFSEDVRKALAAGATQYLPRLYTNCVHFEKRSGIMGTTDIRESATRQSTIFPRSLSGEYRIKFNTIQFFLHHTVNVATHNPPLPTTTPSTFSSRGPSATPNTYGNSSLHTPNTSYATSYNAGTSVGSQRIAGGSGINTNANPFSNQPQQQQYRPQPRPRSIIGDIYEQLMTEYMQYYIPCGGNINNGGASEFHPIIGTFLLDECIETWIRNSWISSGQKLSIERMHYIILFVKHIVGGDLRRCYSDNRQSATTNYQIVYNSIKSELYALISRLALNWSKDDDYLQVVTLWSIWTMPWTLGVQQQQQTKNNIETETYRPIADGWAQYIMENVLFYIPLTGIFLQRIRTFTYPEKLPTPLPSNTTPFNHFHHPSSVTMVSTTLNNNNNIATTPKPSDQLKITCRFMYVFKGEGLIDFLSIVEQSLVRIQSETTHLSSQQQQPASTSCINPQAIDILSTRYFNGQKTYVQQILKKTYDDLIQLDGGTWICPNLFIKDATPRSKPLVEALDALAQACLPQQNTSLSTTAVRPTWGVGTSTSTTKSTQYIKELQEVSKIFASIFSLPKPVLKKQTSTARSIFSSFQQKTTNRSISSTGSSTATAVKKEKIPMAGLKNGGFLTEEERHLIRQGQMRCSHQNIPLVGPRAEEVVRSSEVKFMVRWIIPFDRQMNKYYHRWKPAKVTSMLPEKLTIRPLADTVNIAYLILIIIILFALF